MFSCEYCEIFKKFFYRTPLVAASSYVFTVVPCTCKINENNFLKEYCTRNRAATV